MEIQPEHLVQVNQPQNLTQEMRNQVKSIIASPQVFQYLIEKTIDVMIQNNISISGTASGDFIRGVNRGTLALLNSLVEHIDEITGEE